MNYEPLKSICLCEFEASQNYQFFYLVCLHYREGEHSSRKPPSVGTAVQITQAGLVEGCRKGAGAQSGGSWQAASLAVGQRHQCQAAHLPPLSAPCLDPRRCDFICQRANQGPHWRSLWQPGDQGLRSYISDSDCF